MKIVTRLQGCKAGLVCYNYMLYLRAYFRRFFNSVTKFILADTMVTLPLKLMV